VPKGNGVGKILDVCCGSKMFWFDKNHQGVLFGDIREENHTLCDGRSLEIKPDMKIDFTNLPFEDETYSLVVFDPPHLEKLGANSWMAKKYGVLNNTWQDDIRKGFAECLRVLKTDGVLIFKWNETDITTKEILKLCREKPLFGHISGKRSNTHWITFMKTTEPPIASGIDRTTGGWIGQP
jgi:ubiquinone/menaquinone biosynthesis C-methylase UbiE